MNDDLLMREITPAEASEGPEKKKYENSQEPSSRPYITRRITVRSKMAQTVMKRQFTQMSSKLYQLGVVLRILLDDQRAAIVEKVVDNEFDELLGELLKEKERFAQLLADKGIDGGSVNYTAPKILELRIESQRVGKFINIVQALDELDSLIYCLHVTCIIDEKSYANGLYKWRRLVMATCNRVINTCGRAVAAARQMARDAGGVVELIRKRPKLPTPMSDEMLGQAQEIFAKGLNDPAPVTLDAGEAPDAADRKRDDVFSGAFASALESAHAAADSEADSAGGEAKAA